MPSVYKSSILYSMAIQNEKKLNYLIRTLPEGFLVDSTWMESAGYSRALRKQYVDAGWLDQPMRGVYRRSRGPLGWEQVVASLQSLLSYPVSIGGRTALELQGYGHYVSPAFQDIYLYIDGKLPGWVSKVPIDQEFKIRNRSRLLPKIEPEVFEDESSNRPGALRQIEQGGLALIVSAPERAILEMLDEIPRHETFHNVDVTMEGLVNLRPKTMQSLLEKTKSIKVKRLFFFFADRFDHRWLSKIAREQIDLGTGKRVIAEGGTLDRTYQITVPGNLDAT